MTATPGTLKALEAGTRCRVPVVVAVADNQADMALLKVTLTGLTGCRVFFFSQTGEAHAMIGRQCPEVIIVDLPLPDMKGFDFVHAIRDMPRARYRAVVVISDHSSTDGSRLAHENGADAFIGRPFSPAHVLSVVSNLLESVTAR